MLSIVDLVTAGTITRNLAAYSLAAINNGASFMVGAMPGGAGKTTVMGALLNFVPAEVQLVPADSASVIEDGINSREQRFCCICHEIGEGPYYAYLWGTALRSYFNLHLAGHMMATNLHAATYKEAHQQICGDNGVSQAAFRYMNLIFFMDVDRKGGSVLRQIREVWESNGESEHQQVFGPGASVPVLDSSRYVSTDDFKQARKDIDLLIASGAHTIHDVRAMLLQMRGAVDSGL